MCRDSFRMDFVTTVAAQNNSTTVDKSTTTDRHELVAVPSNALEEISGTRIV